MAEALLQSLSDEGHTTPTPIQRDVIPGMLAGRDILGIAETGTGKTASFVLPILHKFAEEKAAPKAKGCRALIVTPTRELAAQIADVIKIYSRHQKLSVAVIVGGERPGPQISAMANGRDIVVATPGRLIDHMNAGEIRLDHTGVVILDEADQMLDLGFMPAIKKILSALPKKRQTALMSATMPPRIRKLAAEFQHKPLEIRVTPKAKPQAAIAQSVMHTKSGTKSRVITKILSDPKIGSAIVFTRTKRGADRLSRQLSNGGLQSGVIHGNKSQNQRKRALESFKAGQTKILVATDVAARGIDIDDVSHVVNYDMPVVPEAYVHRIGRTGRAGRNGTAISLCDASERDLLRDIEKLIGRQLGVDETKYEDIDNLEVSNGNEAGGNASGEAGRPKKKKSANKKRVARPTANTNRRKPGEQNGRNRKRNGSKSGRPHPGKSTDDGSNAGLTRMLNNIGGHASEA
ncbi:MAG: DEAD/DEAH box helicase [Alphaproteobacteria bacterium]